MKIWHYSLLALTGVFYLWHCASLPYEIMFGAGHDDGWFMASAMSLLQGDWFGPYNQMTLIKGPVYPFFLALTSLSGVSLQFSTAFLHLIAAGVVVYSLSEHLRSFTSKYAVLILLLITQFPVQRVIRDELSLVLLLLIFSLTVVIFLKEKTANQHSFSVLLGTLLGLFMLTREDGGLTAIPLLLFVVSLSLIRYFNKENVKRVTINLFIVMILAYLSGVLYKSANYLKYNAYVGVELLDPDFGEAVSAIYSVREDSPQRYIEVSNAGLKAISHVSPTFHSLEPLTGLEPWRNGTCTYVKSLCGQIGTGYFMWALRDLMFQRGYYYKPETAKLIYRKIASEIHEACKVRKINCANKYLSKVPAYELFDFTELMSFIKTGIYKTLYLPKIRNPSYSISVEGSEKAASFLNISHYLLPKPKVKFYKVTGWYYDKTNSNSWFDAKITSSEKFNSLPLEPSNNKLVDDKNKLMTEAVYLVRQPSPDIANAYHDSKATMQRFEFYAPCSGVDCILTINGVVIGDLKGGIELKYHQPGGLFYIDTISDESKKYLNKTIEKQKESSTKLHNTISKLYNHCAKALFIGGIICYGILLLSALKNKRFETSVLIVTALWFIYLWRIFFLSLISFYWIPTGMGHLYLYPSIAVMPITSFISIYILYDTYLKQFFGAKVASRIN